MSDAFLYLNCSRTYLWAPMLYLNARNSEFEYAGEQGGDWKSGGEEEERDGEEQGKEQEHGHDCSFHPCIVIWHGMAWHGHNCPIHSCFVTSPVL